MLCTGCILFLGKSNQGKKRQHKFSNLYRKGPLDIPRYRREDICYETQRMIHFCFKWGKTVKE